MNTIVQKENRTEERNRLEVQFPAKSCNEKLARTIASVFMLEMNPTVGEVEDVKTAVSEAVTNAIIHGYGEENESPLIRMILEREKNVLSIEIIDHGCGIENIPLAMEPLYTSRPDLERSGMGFAFMEAFTNELKVLSKLGEGTRIIMKKRISGAESQGWKM